MKTFNLIILLTVIGNIESSESLAQMGIIPSVDSVTIIEKVYLHTDRDNYSPGDVVWFKAYLIDAFDRSLSSFSSNLHVELISPSSEIITGKTEYEVK